MIWKWKSLIILHILDDLLDPNSEHVLGFRVYLVDFFKNPKIWWLDNQKETTYFSHIEKNHQFIHTKNPGTDRTKSGTNRWSPDPPRTNLQGSPRWTLTPRVANWPPKLFGGIFFSAFGPIQGHKVHHLLVIGADWKVFYSFQPKNLFSCNGMVPRPTRLFGVLDGPSHSIVGKNLT
jgi:hypothetical protein